MPNLETRPHIIRVHPLTLSEWIRMTNLLDTVFASRFWDSQLQKFL